MSNFNLTITAGKYKGKKLNSASLDSTRSTKSIIKGSLFDTLQFEILDQVFVEVFGGSGSIGLEAISRGAKSAYFIENDFQAYKVLGQNCNLIDQKATEIFLGDSFHLYPQIIQSIVKHNQKAYLYFDPPFDIRDGMDDIYDKVYTLIADTPKEVVKMIIIEHSSNVKISKSIGIFTLKKTKKFGKSSLSYFTFI